MILFDLAMCLLVFGLVGTVLGIGEWVLNKLGVL